jgi:hypothetical protein
MPGVVEHRSCWTPLDDLPGIHHRDAVCAGVDHREIVADE